MYATHMFRTYTRNTISRITAAQENNRNFKHIVFVLQFKILIIIYS